LLSLPQSEYRGILKSVGLEEAPTGELLERELKVLGRKKEAEMTYHRLRESVETSKGLDQPGSAPGSTEEVEYSAIVNDSTDAEGEPDTTASAPPIATETVNGEKVQKVQAQGGEIKVKPSPAPEVCTILPFGSIANSDSDSKKYINQRTTTNFRSVAHRACLRLWC
jgi:hypothetical protein